MISYVLVTKGTHETTTKDKEESGNSFSERESFDMYTKHLGYKIKIHVVLPLSTAIIFKHNY